MFAAAGCDDIDSNRTHPTAEQNHQAAKLACQTMFGPIVEEREHLSLWYQVGRQGAMSGATAAAGGGAASRHGSRGYVWCQSDGAGGTLELTRAPATAAVFTGLKCPARTPFARARTAADGISVASVQALLNTNTNTTANTIAYTVELEEAGEPVVLYGNPVIEAHVVQGCASNTRLTATPKPILAADTGGAADAATGGGIGSFTLELDEKTLCEEAAESDVANEVVIVWSARTEMYYGTAAAMSTRLDGVGHDCLVSKLDGLGLEFPAPPEYGLDASLEQAYVVLTEMLETDGAGKQPQQLEVGFALVTGATVHSKGTLQWAPPAPDSAGLRPSANGYSTDGVFDEVGQVTLALRTPDLQLQLNASGGSSTSLRTVTVQFQHAEHKNRAPGSSRQIWTNIGQPYTPTLVSVVRGPAILPAQVWLCEVGPRGCGTIGSAQCQLVPVDLCLAVSPRVLPIITTAFGASYFFTYSSGRNNSRSVVDRSSAYFRVRRQNAR